MSDVTGRSAWARFWNTGRWWKAVLLVVVYFIAFQALSFAVLPLVPFAGDDPGTAAFTVIFFALPILGGGILLVIFGASVGWLRGLFARQPIRGSGWMWIAIAVVLVFNILHMLSVDYSKAPLDFVFTWLLTGLFVGFAEEVVTRGYVVKIMRDAGHKEIAVALTSAGLFAFMHAGNAFGGAPLSSTAFQLVYTFFFGILMYLAMRVTGTIIAPILLHASTDPSIFIHTEYPAESSLGSIAGTGNIIVIVAGLVLVFFIRGRVGSAAERAETFA
ncbi:hypothetical protein SRABI76_03038 [Microbacterium oxydans]|uniref:CAAX amino terminal protease self-immunity n=1 Tax=Microbacterium oxydans TaxID=82380 RepID=A0A0F0L895_9MICO|nr:CPBP family intramembrane glutamic endopeptidase [Microbacterium oxydans]KJL27756.1 CAAX amino terminal protease self- immunity [Microbacterium oxydans]CAH0242499.1 hypothetical protein SRABI76_03038 [Microbacterium oxydans]